MLEIARKKLNRTSYTVGNLKTLLSSSRVKNNHNENIKILEMNHKASTMYQT